ncbi:GNAT family N-acetyltransferase [Enhygromyxa salina]|uniref:GNAT family N-acetyltransferase n=1 Tax=Enhygromyxa salina TaxID=215803 RepID=UPI001FD2F419|nr:GNAT family N-acetyltransferase [Enhygromyxa salina]
MDLTLTERKSIESVERASWNALEHAPSPFLEWGFLRALEISGSVGPEAGWDPHYLLVHGDPPSDRAELRAAQENSPDRAGERDQRGPQLLGAVAAYVKDHSYGEYIFDFHWARASTQAGIPYYPKLVIAAPATPATGRRILLHPSLDEAGRHAVTQRLIEGVRALADDRKCGSIHWLFTTEDEREQLVAAGFAARSSFQFHWHNRGYANFDEFLAQLTSRKRKQIRKERRRAQAQVDAIRFVPGAELTATSRAALDRFYRRTTNLYGGRQYLRPTFFQSLLELAPERVRFLEAICDSEPIAGALFFETEQGLYGRYWGCDHELEFLHFEAAYYAGIERCIELGLPLFEAGAQGEHKLLRGFLPVICHSAHWLRHPGLDHGVREFLREETRAIAHHVRELHGYGPYRADSA